jgi:two-component system, NarL family, invasion response regulator UvrY
MITVFIADDHSLIREGIKNILNSESDIKLVGETSDPFEVVDLLNKLHNDITILDISMPGKNGLELLKEIKSAGINTKILMMTMMPEEQFARRALKAGASGYLTKDSAANEIITAIRRIANGRKYVSSSLSEKLVDDLDENANKEPYEILSDREFEILRMLAAGKQQSDIASELNLSPSTVNTYRGRILEKLNLQSNAEIIHFAYKNKLIE